MARGERQRPSIYFGKPGALVTLPWPRGDIDRTYERATYDFVTGSGQHAVSSMAGGSRIYTMKWNALHIDTFRLLEQYWTGQMGLGPWALIDPSAPNLLLGNQASATNLFYDNRGWSTGLEGTLTSSTPTGIYVRRAGGTRNLRWQFNGSIGSFPVLKLTPPYRNWAGFPVMQGLPYTFSAALRPDSVVDTSITVAAKIMWHDATGAQLTESSGGDFALTGWTALSVTANPVANAAYAYPRFVATGSTITQYSSLYIDEVQFEQDSVVNPWAPGTGIRAVEILSLTENVPFAARARTDISMVLRELAI